MKDIIGEDIMISDTVCYAPDGAYAGISLGVVEKFTPKSVGIRNFQGGRGRRLSNPDERLYYTLPSMVLVVRTIVDDNSY